MEDLSSCQHPRFAHLYRKVSEVAEQRGIAQVRQRLLADLSGRVVEIGAGNGLNFAHYPPTVTEVIAVEPDDDLRAMAEKANTTVPVRVVAGVAEALPAEDGTVDAAVTSLVLCSVPSVAGALADIMRVLRPGGELRFFEHVRSKNWVIGQFEAVITPLWSRFTGGCHLDRDTAAEISAAGFGIDSIERLALSPLPVTPRHAYIVGRAIKPR